MPAYYTESYSSDNLRFSLKPKGIRNIFKSCLPYLTGDTLDLELKVKSSTNKVSECTYEWQLQDLIPETRTFRVVAQQGGSFKTKPRGIANIQLGIHHLILYEAEYHVILKVNHGKETQSHTLLVFYAMSKDLYRTNHVNSLMGGFIGAAVGLLVGLLINWIN